jgi:hypothetical protein
MAWNAIFTAPGELDRWLQAARHAGQRPLIAFNRSRVSQCPRDPCKAPDPGAYARAAQAFFHKYPWVHDVQPWNEANSATQPTAKHPGHAAAYYRAIRAACPRCAVPAADLLADGSAQKWLVGFRHALGGKLPRLWGLHNYPDANRFTDDGTREFLRLVPGKVWITESGGIVKFSTHNGQVRFPPNEQRAARATRQAVALAGVNRRITRLYLYQWQLISPQESFDSAFIRPDGSARPALAVLRGLLPKR